ncbi:MAG: (2Fe-2S) ferredoxin domain-containing protein [Raineya sp.]|nr:(2Fe-2S) ferredoxin domain-containing protein [Raineya sp.]MDW8295330.1 (2Fe-2S) ferredoxin domain-containing protein [Raineya sp.]
MGKKYDLPSQVICMCMGSKCRKYNKDYYKELKETLKKYHLHHQVEILKTDCTGRCKLAPVVCFQPQNHWLIDFSEKEWQRSLDEILSIKP